jgi:hypothetical protein
MNRTFILPAALLLSSVLTAQTGAGVAVTLATADAVGVHANRQIDAARTGTAIDQPLVLQAQDGRETAAHSVAQRDPLRTPQGPALGALFSWRGRAADGDLAGTLGGSPLSAGAQAYGLLLTARQAVPGRLVILFDGDGIGGGGARASVVVGNETRGFATDGTAQRASIDNLTIGGRGLRVAIQIAGRAAGQGGVSAFHAHLRVAFVPDASGPGCQVLPGTASCAEGGVLRGQVSGTTRGGVLQLNLGGALPDAIGLTVVSPSGSTFPILNTGCVFFDRAIVHETFRTDANGDARTQVMFPLRQGGSFFVQQATVVVSPRGLRLGTSNTLEVRCN